MKLNENTLKALKTFATINSNIVISPGNVLKTISEAKNVFGRAEVPDTFASEIGIYDLPEFLSVIDMFDDPSFDIDDSNDMVVLSEDRSRVKYYFSDPSILTTPSKDIIMPSVDVSFEIIESDISALNRAANSLGTSDLMVEGAAGEGGVKLSICELNNPTAHQFSIDIDEATRPDDPFTAVFNIKNFRFAPGGYDVDISKKLISHFTNKSEPIEYWVALEKDSKFGG